MPVIDTEGLIRKAYLDRGCALVLPQDVLASDEASATEALLRLADEGKLDVIVTLYCLDGHTVWRGSPRRWRQLNEASPHDCRLCAYPGDYGEGSTERSFEISSSWRDTLDEEKSARAER